MSMAVGEVRRLWGSYNNFERDGIKGISEVYRVFGVNADIANGGMLPGVPKFRDQHPDDSGLIVKSVSATNDGAGALVTVVYSPPEYVQSSLPPVNIYDDGFIGKDVSFEYEDVDIPLVERVDMAFEDQGATVIKQVFQRVDAPMKYRKRVAYYRVPIAVEMVGTTLGDVFNVTRYITSQIGKIHTIFGEDLVFSCEGFSQQTETKFNAVYRWYKDPGVKLGNLRSQFTLSYSMNLRAIGTTIWPIYDDDYLIPPHKGVQLIGAQDPEDAPDVKFFDIYEREPNGWQTLPGIA